MRTGAVIISDTSPRRLQQIHIQTEEDMEQAVEIAFQEAEALNIPMNMAGADALEMILYGVIENACKVNVRIADGPSSMRIEACLTDRREVVVCTMGGNPPAPELPAREDNPYGLTAYLQRKRAKGPLNDGDQLLQMYLNVWPDEIDVIRVASEKKYGALEHELYAWMKELKEQNGRTTRGDPSRRALPW